jgi:pilus assembly protein CpaC
VTTRRIATLLATALVPAVLGWTAPAGAEQPSKPQPAKPAAAADAVKASAEPPLPAAAPRMKVVKLDAASLAQPRPLPPLSTLDRPGSVVRVPMNKTKPIDLPGSVAEVVIGSPEIADVLVRSPSQVFLMAKSVGDTNLFFLDRNGKLISRMEVHVHADIEGVKAALQQYLPEEAIEVGAVGNAVTLSGTVRSDAAAATAVQLTRRLVPADENIVNLMKVAGEQQVMLRVKVVEMNRQVMKGLNTDWTIGSNNATGDADVTAAVGQVIGNLSTSSFTSLSTAFLPYAATLEIQAAETDKLVQTLAEPVLVSMSGEEARVMAGTEYPVAVTNITNGVAYTTVDYRDIGVSLIFTPVIVGPGRINLKIGTAVTTIESTSSSGYPVLSSRRASAAVEVPSGGTMMIAGVLRNDLATTMEGVPGIMDVPILGALFRSNSFARQESEMVVLVQPYIVQPTQGQKLALPSDGFQPASDLDRDLLGRLNRVYNKSDVAPKEAPSGPIGYIVQ